jgi:hypothetical protein
MSENWYLPDAVGRQIPGNVDGVNVAGVGSAVR